MGQAGHGYSLKGLYKYIQNLISNRLKHSQNGDNQKRRRG